MALVVCVSCVADTEAYFALDFHNIVGILENTLQLWGRIYSFSMQDSGFIFSVWLWKFHSTFRNMPILLNMFEKMAICT